MTSPRGKHAAGPEDLDAQVVAPEASETCRAPRSRGRKVVRVVVIVLLVIVLVLAVAVGVVALLLRQSMRSGEEKILAAAKPKAVASAVADSSSSEAPKIDGTVSYNGQRYAPNDKMVSIAFIGFDGAEAGGNVGQADTVIVVSFNLESGKVSAISIPRDSMVEVGEYLGDAYVGQSMMQLCLAYSYGDGSWTSSQHVADLASRILYDVPVSYYFTLNLAGIGAINDSLGGITLTAAATIPNTDIVEGQEVTLWGDDAMRYVRWRDTSYETSSLDRQDRQVQYLKAFVARLMEVAKSDPAALLNLYNTAVQYSWTNVGADEFTYLASQVLEHGLGSLTTVTLPGEMQMGMAHAEYYLDKAGVRQIVMDTYYHLVDGEAGA